MQVLGVLSEDLGLKVLRAVHRPFDSLLRYLTQSNKATPLRLLLLLLRACHPSIDATASLHLRPVFTPDVAAALSSIASLTHLQSLSLAEVPLGHMYDEHSASTVPLVGVRVLEHVLRALPQLTSLCLRGTLLHVCSEALAAALPALPRLATLDASGNRLDGEVEGLAAALPSTLALRTLLLHGAFTTPRAVCALAVALRQMPLLEALSIGSPRRRGAEYGSEMETDMLAVLRALNSMASLSALDFNYAFNAESTAALGTAVAALTQLRHLRLLSLDIWSPAGIDVGSGLAQMRLLSSLDLSDAGANCGCEHNHAAHEEETPAGVMLVRVLACISALTGLQKLQLPYTHLETATCVAIASTVRRLTQLSQAILRKALICDDRQALWTCAGPSSPWPTHSTSTCP